ncbi:MAG: DNA repair protein RecN [Deltaproteobacteria bacterium RBG_16_48_10]|nr:MAG: DNA repair protein RecN [Deltaproteobacteria bacterium RBG_16_48_10]
MLQELRIRNLAIIDSLDISLSQGLNILSGETGAGKSIILNAVQLLLGGKATEEMIRGSEEEGSVEALFDVSGNRKVLVRAREKFSSSTGREEDSLVLRRTLSRSGRGKAFINGNLSTLGMLSEMGEDLLSLYGQHEHQSLQRVETHIDILDEFGGLRGLREEFQNLFQEFAGLSEEIQGMREEQEKRAKERELMIFQSREIETSGLQTREEEALKEEQRILAHAQKLIGFVHASEEMLYGEEGSALDKIQAILHQSREMVAMDPSLSPLIKTMESSLIQLEEVARAFRDYGRRVEINPERLEAVEDRLEEIDRLKRKYGSTVETVLLFKKEIDDKLGTFTFNEERLSELENRLKPLEQKVLDLSKRLSEERKNISTELRKSIEKELGSLGMKKAVFQVQMSPLPLSIKGMDRVEFLISPNIGEEVKPLAKIASGGELSRMMLAMKRILSKVGGRQVLIFDEVDSGIGGAIAEVVGKKLKELSKDHQVICVTHLPQIACYADSHYSVRKEVKGGRTLTRVDWLEKERVIDEIARMLGGVKVTEKTRAHAKEMIENTKKP